MGRKLLREPEVLARVGFGRTKFETDFVATGRVKWVRIGERIKALPSDELDQLIDEIVAERDAKLAAAEGKADAAVVEPARAPASPPKQAAKRKQQKTTKVPAREASK
jgi:hypothetical protein